MAGFEALDVRVAGFANRLRQDWVGDFGDGRPLRRLIVQRNNNGLGGQAEYFYCVVEDVAHIFLFNAVTGADQQLVPAS